MKSNQIPCNVQHRLRAGGRAFIVTSLAALLALTHPGRLSAQLVQFPDTNLENALSAALSVPAGSITAIEMQGLGQFNGNWRNIQDTTGLETAWNLTNLALMGDPLTNSAALARLTNLTRLDLYNCQLTNVSFLAGLTNLTYLELNYNPISNAAPISVLTRLTVLSMSDDTVSDISPFAGLTNLHTLDVSQNQITNIPPLTDLTNLTALSLQWNQALTNASQLAGLTGLYYLELDGDTISNYSMLAGLTNLDDLYLNSTGVADLSPLIPLADLQILEVSGAIVTNAFVLSNLTSLQYLQAENIGLTNAAFATNLPSLYSLDLAENRLTDAGFLSQMPQLENAYLDGNQLTRLPDLSGLASLSRLTLDDNHLTNIDGAAGAASLQDLSLEDNQLTNLPPLAGLYNLTSLDLYANPLTTLAGLDGLTNVTFLEMSDISTLTNFDALSQLTALQDLDAGESRFSDLAPLATLTNLNSLYLTDDDVGDLEPLRGLPNLTEIYLQENVLTSIDALTNLVSPDYLYLADNLIDFSSGMHNANDLQFLQNEGAYVQYLPQYSPLPQFGIAVQPADQAVFPGSTAVFSVTVNRSISPLHYQWQFQDADMPGQTADTLTLPGVQYNQAGRYRVRVTDTTVSGWHIYSRSAQLQVQGGTGTPPDLTFVGAVETIPNPVHAGSMLTVSYTITNLGGDAPTSNTRIEIKPASGGSDATAVVHSTSQIAAGAALADSATVPIPASAPPGTYTVYVTLDCDDSIGQVDRVNNVAQTAVGSLTILPPITFGAALNAPYLTFTTGGDAPWFVETTKTYDGISAAQSGAIGQNQSSTLSTTVIGPGNISFWWTIDAGTGDALFFGYPGGGSGIANRGGEWAYESSVEIPPGPATLNWEFWRDSSPDVGADAAWVGDITYTSYVPIISSVTCSPKSCYPGKSCVVTASLAGPPATSYQWYLNGAPIPGGTADSYGPFVAACSNSGTYSLVLSNSVGMVTNSGSLLVAPIFYQITDLGSIWSGGVYNYANGLNNFGDVVGSCESNSTGTGHAWLWSKGVMTDLGDAFGTGDALAYAINDEGTVVGTGRVMGSWHYDAAKWFTYPGGYQVYDISGSYYWPYTSAEAVNNAGDVLISLSGTGLNGAGSRTTGLLRQYDLLPLGSSVLPVWPPDYGDAYGWGMNSLGLVVGSSLGSASAGSENPKIAWLYNGSCRENLQTLYSLTNFSVGDVIDSTGAYCVNDYGDIGGMFVNTSVGFGACFVISGTTPYVVSRYDSYMNGINNQGDVLYASNGIWLYCSTSISPARLANGAPDYSDHAAFALTNLLGGNLGGFINLDCSPVNYNHINETRSIIGDGTVANGDTHAFLATPLPIPGNHPPSAVALTVTNQSRTLVLPISKLLANATDPDGDTLGLVTTTQPDSGDATVRRSGNNLIYQALYGPPSTDTFSWIITDYHGGMATNVVHVVNLPSGPSPQPNHILLLGSPGPSLLIRFHGTAGQTWRIQACDDLKGAAWTTIATVMAGSDGLIDATEAIGIHSSRFYRAVNP
jgi:internalin A